jgi:hypothetical protein
MQQQCETHAAALTLLLRSIYWMLKTQYNTSNIDSVQLLRSASNAAALVHNLCSSSSKQHTTRLHKPSECATYCLYSISGSVSGITTAAAALLNMTSRAVLSKQYEQC